MAFDFEDDNYESIFNEAITVNKYIRQGFEFSSDHKTLLMAPKDIIEFEVPQYVVSIGPSAFKGCKMLERIVLHNSFVYFELYIKQTGVLPSIPDNE